MAVIDAHAHIYPDKIAAAAVDAVGDFYEVNMFGDGTAAGLLSAKDRSPITHFLVHSVATSVHAVTAINNAIAQASQAHPEFKSRPTKPHPLFNGFVAAALKHRDEE